MDRIGCTPYIATEHVGSRLCENSAVDIITLPVEGEVDERFYYMTNSYIAYYKPGPNWLESKPLKDQPLKTHVDYLVALHRDGNVIMGGPFADGSGGLVVFAADDIVDVNEFVSRDPAVAEGILVANIKPWARIV